MLRILFNLVIILFFCSSCANYNFHYDKSTADWASKKQSDELAIAHTVFLIGDAGYYASLEENKTLQLFEEHLKVADENSSVIFLGDNIYPSGFPAKSEEDAVKKEAISKLNVQLNILDNYAGRPYFIAGNHDWSGDDVKGVRRQEKYIEKYLNKNIEDKDDWENYFLPDKGCGGPEVVEVNDQLVIIFIDSNWYLKDWDKAHPSINNGCEALSRPVFRFLFEELMRKYKNKNVIVASHHPLFTYGPHGGKSSWKEHIFPLTQWNQKNYVPIPVLGTLATFYRAFLGSRQDIAHPIYRRFKDDLLAGATKNGSYIFASGHEHNLQYIELEGQQFIVSGGGSKESPVAMGKGAKFTYGGKGFSKIDFYEDGSAWISFYSPYAASADKLLYRQKIKDKLAISEDNIPSVFPEFELNQTTIDRNPTLMNVSEKKGLYNVIMGKHYRDLYNHQYTFPVLDLKDFEGGAIPLKRGGGNQTNSLRLLTTDGRQFAMRALTKDASRLVPYPINKMTIANSVAEENFMSTHPFAPLAVPKLADAANVYHTNPKLYYVPKQPALGVHNDLFGGDVYLIEERPAKGHEQVVSFGNSEKFYSTHDVVEKITDSDKHVVDQNWVIRSRLFDMLIGDWDRHDDQWRWGMKKENGKRVYRPIPRDRDQAFSKYDGLVSATARLFMPFLRQLKTYDYEIKNKTRWDNWSSRFFNMTFLNQISWEEWEKEANYLKTHLTDEVIEEAFQAMPAFAYDESAPELIAKLKKRRDDILRYAREFYEFYADEIVVLGTDEKEKFKITRMENGKTLVEVFRKKNKVYSRLFDYKTTKEIHLYGLGGDDKFDLKGKSGRNSLVRIIGGANDDKVEDKSEVGGGKRTFVYDTEKGIKIKSEGETKDKTSKYKLLNYFDRRDVQYEHNFDTKLPVIGFNDDDGLIIGGTYRRINYKFKKYPFAQEHKASANYGFATRAIALDYSGKFIEVLGRWDITTTFQANSDKNTFNFFGFGNDTRRVTRNQTFNEVRLSHGLLDIAVQKRLMNNSAFVEFYPLAEWFNVQKTPNRLVTQTFDPEESDIYDSNFYLGAGMAFELDNVDNFADPRQGIKFNVTYNWRTKMDMSKDQFSALNSKLTLYIPLDKRQNLVFATRLGTGINFGENIDFYYGQTVGGEFLRGFRNERFLGSSSFFHNNDLRLNIISSANNILPFSIGLHTGLDYGRVWLNQDGVANSNTWHFGYGGGFWIAPVDIAILSFGFYNSSDDYRFIMKVGHSF